jgi:uncharacterized protein YjbJ (UPF0337 family)
MVSIGMKFPDNGNNLKAKRKKKWGKLTDDEIDVVEGKRDQLVGKMGDFPFLLSSGEAS